LYGQAQSFLAQQGRGGNMFLAKLTRTVLSLALLAAGVTGAWGQVTTGSILGTIKDVNGGAVARAEVTVRDVDTGATRVLMSDEAGRYRASQLSPGTYEVKAELSGFKTEVRKGIELAVGQEAVVDFLLQVGTVTESVTVTGEAPLLDSTTATVSGLVDEKMMRDLPLNVRSLEQFALLMPTVSQQRNFDQSLKQGLTPKISAAGLRPDQNVFLLDGTDVMDYSGQTPGSAAGALLGVETIKEYEVLTHTYGAEFGRLPGAVVNMVTRSGSNELHGTLFEFLRNDIFDARNFFDPQQIPPLRRNQFGGVLGGPIKKDRTFFFVSYEALRNRVGSTNTSFVPDNNARQGILPNPANPGQPIVVGVNPAVQPYLNLYPVANGPDVGGGVAEFTWPFSQSADEDYFMVKIDHRINSSHSLFGRYTFDDTRVANPLALPIFESQFKSRNQYTTIGETWVISQRAVNDSRFAFNRTTPGENYVPTFNFNPSLAFVPGQGPGIMIVGNASGVGGAISQFGGDSGDPSHWYRNVFQAIDNFTYSTGRHTLKFGADFERLQTNTSQLQNRSGVYLFDSLAHFLGAQPYELDRNSGTGTASWRQSLFGLYLQDDYKPTSKLTLNLGFRYEITSVLEEVNGKATNLVNILDPAVHVGESFQNPNPSLKDVAPRIGLAWQPLSRTVVRLGVGLYYQQLMDAPYISRPEQNTTANAQVVISFPAFPTVTSIPPGSQGASNVDVRDNPTVIQSSLNIQEEITPNTEVEIGYVGTRGTDLIALSEGNIANPVILPNGTTFFPPKSPRRNPKFGGVKRETADAESNYNALTVRLQRRFTRALQFQASYTYSKALDDASAAAGPPNSAPGFYMESYYPQADYGLSDFDMRNNLSVSFIGDLPIGPGKAVGGNTSGLVGSLLGGWGLSGIVSVQSGTPVTPVVGFNIAQNKNTTGADRPNLKPGVTKVPILGSPNKYFDPSVFQLQSPGFYGNAGRNIIIGPGQATLDLAMLKNISLTEKLNLQFRAEAYNLFNRANFGEPAATIFDSSGPVGSAGVITRTKTTSRQLQFGLKLLF
jgi:outer membrane receptor protein involved in Fe transport